MPFAEFDLDIDRDELLMYYAGDSVSIVAWTDDGVRVRFPASAVRPFVNHVGVRGRFRLYYSTDGRLERLVRMASDGA